MKIYLVRHGQTQWNKEGRMQGWQNSDLTELGVENAKKLSQALADVDIDVIYCTPLNRTFQTAAYIRGEREIPIVVNEYLKEFGFGIWEGMTHEEIQALHPEAYHHFWKQTDLYQPIDGETFECLFKRVKQGMEEIMAAQGENVVVVAHGVVIKAIYSIYKNIPMSQFWGPPYIHDTCLTIMEVKDGNLEFLLEADISHLER